MNARTRKLLDAAEQAVGRLVQECRKGTPLYALCPKAVAQVSRTGKWLLNATAVLAQELNALATPEGDPKQS